MAPLLRSKLPGLLGVAGETPGTKPVPGLGGGVEEEGELDLAGLEDVRGLGGTKVPLNELAAVVEGDGALGGAGVGAGERVGGEDGEGDQQERESGQGRVQRWAAHSLVSVRAAG